MSIEGQGHFFTIYFPGFVCFVLYLAKISGERLQDHWSSGFINTISYFMIYQKKMTVEFLFIGLSKNTVFPIFRIYLQCQSIFK